MKSKLPIFIVAACTALSTHAQEEPGTFNPSGLKPFTTKEPQKPNEVTVVLAPPVSEDKPAPAPEELPPASPAGQPLIESLDSLSESEPEPAPAQPAKHQGVSVRVEKLQTAAGPIDPAGVTLVAPFPAKPLSTVPRGWKIANSDTAPPFVREIELSPGSKITLNIRPHVLVPDTDGETTFAVNEPGFDTTLGYRQNATVGAVIYNSVRHLEEESRQMNDVIDRLQQLLVSLPQASVDNPPPVAQPVTDP